MMNIAPNQIGIPYGGGTATAVEYDYPEGCIISDRGRALCNGKGEIIVNPKETTTH